MNSSFLKLNLFDIVKGFVVAALTVIVGNIVPVLQSGTLPSIQALGQWGIAGLAAGLAYLLKNLFTNSSGSLLNGEKK